MIRPRLTRQMAEDIRLVANGFGAETWIRFAFSDASRRRRARRAFKHLLKLADWKTKDKPAKPPKPKKGGLFE